MKKNISDMMDNIQDDTVSILIQNTASTQRIQEATMKKIHAAQRHRNRLLPRILFIAALLIMAFSAAAFTVYRLSFESFRGPMLEVSSPAPSDSVDENGNVTTSQSVIQVETKLLLPDDTVQGKAGKEWNACMDKMQEEGKNSWQDDTPDYPGYALMRARTQEARDQLDIILAKYHLTLPTEDEYLLTLDELYAHVGIQDFLPEEGGPLDMETMSTLNGFPLCFWSGGNGNLRIGDAARLPDGRNLAYRLICINRKTFSQQGVSVGSIDDYESWNYTTSGGTQVVLAMEENSSMMMAMLEHCYVYISIASGTENAGGNSDAADFAAGMPTVDRGTLEMLAEQFDFAAIDSLAA